MDESKPWHRARDARTEARYRNAEPLVWKNRWKKVEKRCTPAENMLDLIGLRHETVRHAEGLTGVRASQMLRGSTFVGD